jgi:hypothetical protein
MCGGGWCRKTICERHQIVFAAVSQVQLLSAVQEGEIL